MPIYFRGKRRFVFLIITRGKLFCLWRLYLFLFYNDVIVRFLILLLAKLNRVCFMEVTAIKTTYVNEGRTEVNVTAFAAVRNYQTRFFDSLEAQQMR